MKMKRFVIGLAAFTIATMVTGSLVLWLLLARWVPTEGKRHLVQELEQRWPVTVSIGEVRYGLLRGLTLEQVRVIGRDTREVWCVIPSLHLSIGRLALLQRRIAFRGRVSLEVPCPTQVSLAGVYSLRDRSLAVAAQTGEVPLRLVTAPLVRYVPPELTDGTVQLQLHLLHSPQERLELAGRLTGRGLMWTAPAGQMTADLLLNGTVLPPTAEGSRWAAHADARLSHGSFEGTSPSMVITRMEGTARLTEDGLDIEELSGTLLDSPWKLEGGLTFTPARMEVLLSARQQLAPLAAAFPGAAPDWHPEGVAALRTVCRVALERRQLVDCQMRADVRDATVKGAKLMEPLTNVSGTMAIDWLTRQLSIDSLSGRLRGEPLSLHGTADLRPLGRLALHASGTAPLDAVTFWLSPATPVRQLPGKFDFNLDIDGTTAPGITVVARFPEGELQLTGRVTPEALIVEESRLSLEKSRLTAKGRLARAPERPSTLAVSGTVELAELTTIPFLPLPALEPWAMRGAAEVQGEFQGRLDDWRSASLRARVRSAHLQARQLPLDQLVCAIEQSNHTLRAQIPSALFADGKLAAELTLAHLDAARPDVSLQADLIGVALDRLAQVVPAWRNRSVTGRASGHATLSGTWQARKSWKGEGWLKADGERLGDVPLLDRFFRSGLVAPLAEWLGFESMRRAEIQQVSLRWRLANEQVSTEDLRLVGLVGAAAVVLYARGSAGLDHTINFEVEPEFSEQIVQQSRVIGSATAVLPTTVLVEAMSKVARYHVTGTLEEPKTRFQFTPQEAIKWMVAEAAGGLLGGLLQ